MPPQHLSSMLPLATVLTSITIAAVAYAAVCHYLMPLPFCRCCCHCHCHRCRFPPPSLESLLPPSPPLPPSLMLPLTNERCRCRQRARCRYHQHAPLLRLHRAVQDTVLLLLKRSRLAKVGVGTSCLFGPQSLSPQCSMDVVAFGEACRSFDSQGRPAALMSCARHASQLSFCGPVHAKSQPIRNVCICTPLQTFGHPY